METNFDKNGGVITEVNLKPDVYTSVPNEYVTVPTAPSVETESAEEFVTAPEEFTTGSDTESSEEFSAPENELAATADEYNNFDEAYGKDDVYEAEYYQNSIENSDYDTEAADDFEVSENSYDTESGEDYGMPDNAYGTESSEDYNVSDSYDGSDETAATCNEFYNGDTTEAQRRCALDDYEIISDVLGCEKQLVKLYSTALCEAAEEPFRDIIRENLTECAADQFKTFEYMNKNGMYETEQAPQEQIAKTKEQFGPLCDCHND